MSNFPGWCLLANRKSDGGWTQPSISRNAHTFLLIYRTECSRIFKLARQTVGWTQPSSSRNAHTIYLLTGRNAHEFSKSQVGRWDGTSPVSAEMITFPLHFSLSAGRNARAFSNSQGGQWGGPSTVPTGMLTLFVYVQNGMPTKL